MGDRHGTTLSPGDPVIYVIAEGVGSSATVLQELDGGRYLIQLDKHLPRASSLPAGTPASVVAWIDQADTTVRTISAEGIDPQDVIEVDGHDLEFLGEWGDEEQDD